MLTLVHEQNNGTISAFTARSVKFEVVPGWGFAPGDDRGRLRWIKGGREHDQQGEPIEDGTVAVFGPTGTVIRSFCFLGPDRRLPAPK